MRIVRAAGEPYELGRQVGDQIADLAAAQLEDYEAVWPTLAGDREERVHACLGPAQSHAPDQVAYLMGLAEGAGVPFEEVFAVQAYEEIESETGWPAEGCTDLYADGRIAHTEDWLAFDIPYTVGLLLEPTGKPALAGAGTGVHLPLCGVNAAGIAHSCNSVPCGWRPGVPRLIVAAQVFEARNLEEAVELATSEHRAGGYNHNLSDGVRNWALETSPTTHALIEDATAHTNHYCALEHATREPESPSSRERLRLAQQVGRGDLHAALASEGISRKPSGGPPAENSATSFAAVMDPAAGTLDVCQGPPEPASEWVRLELPEARSAAEPGQARAGAT